MPLGAILWGPGPYPSTGIVRVRPNSRRYQTLQAHTSNADSEPPERDPENWLDLGPTPVPVEIEWAAYAVQRIGDQVIRTQTHRRYRSVKALTAAENVVAPELAPDVWQDIGPTNRWAPFDIYANTRATGTGALTYVLKPGFFNSLALYGLVGTQYSVTVKDAPSGSTMYSRTGFLADDPDGWYEYLFITPTPRQQIVLAGIPIRATAEVTITITSGVGQPVGIGMIVVGDMDSLIGAGAEWGGVEHGASAEPTSYSYIHTDEYGQTRIVRRHAATNLRCSIKLPRRYADSALQKIRAVLDQPVAVIASDKPGFAGLNVFGLISSAPVSYDSFNVASIEFTVKGLT